MSKKLNQATTITEPVLSITTKTGTTHKVYAYGAGQRCSVGQASCLQFGYPHTKSAGLVVVTESAGTGTRAEEVNIDDGNTWAWVGKWMRAGMIAAGYVDADAPESKEAFEALEAGVQSASVAQIEAVAEELKETEDTMSGDEHAAQVMAAAVGLCGVGKSVQLNGKEYEEAKKAAIAAASAQFFGFVGSPGPGKESLPVAGFPEFDPANCGKVWQA